MYSARGTMLITVTIMAFVASIQIASYDLVKVGDWIEIPSLGVDGDVMDMALHTIKVRNFDKTITTVPTNKLIEQSFKNWRGMQDTGSRRIKRSIHIDLSSIKFLSDEMLTRFNKFQLISEYLKDKKNELENDNNEKNVDTSELINGRSGISTSMALRLSKAFGTTPELWLNMQQNYDLWKVKKKTRLSKVKVLFETSISI